MSFIQVSSVCSAKVRFARAEKRIDWQGVYIDSLKSEHFTPEYLALNSKDIVPILVHDDLVIPEGTVIIEYLDQIAPKMSVHPQIPWNARRRAIGRSSETCTRPAARRCSSARTGTRSCVS